MRALARLEEAHLLFLGAEGAYAERLREHSAICGLKERVHFLPPAPLEALLSYTSQADVGVSLLEDSCENHRLALPNKLFEYVAARVPVVVSNLPEMGRLVRERGIGWSVNSADPESVAAGLRAAISSRGDQSLHHRLEAAAAELNWEHEKSRLLAVYEELEERRGESRGGAIDDA